MNKTIKHIRNSVMLLGLIATSPLNADAGKLYLVSTGCGDIDNMTIRAYKVIESADVVFTMRGDDGKYEDLLKGKEIHAAGHILFGMEGKSTRAEKGDAKGDKREHAKTGDGHKHGDGEANEAGRKDQIRAIIRNAVKDGKNVAILDSGDPTIFGPQMGYMKEFADLDPVVIPGVSSFNAANAALKRGVVGGMGGGRSIALTSSPRPRGSEEGSEAMNKADPADAIVFFTMHSDFSVTVDELKKHYASDTPIAIVLYAGYADKERVIKGTLEDIIGKVGNEKLPFEHLIYVGSFIADKE